MALLLSVVFRLNTISLVRKWQSDLSHLDQGPMGDRQGHGLRCRCANQR